MGAKVNARTLSFNVFRRGDLVYPCDIYNIYVEKLEDQEFDQYLGLGNTCLTFYYKTETTTQASPPAQPDTTPDAIVPEPLPEQEVIIDP